jgi:hypothetical protein
MSLAVLNRMLRKILLLGLNFEKVFKKNKHRKVAQNKGATGEGRSEEFVSGIHAGSTQAKIPDPWYN